GLWAASILVSTRGLSTGDAGLWVSVYFGAITVGRFGVGLVSNRLGNRQLVQLGVGLAALGASVFSLPQLLGPLASFGLVLMGLGCAPVFPSLMHETTRRFPTDVARTVIGRQMSLAYVGGSVVPAFFGLVATWASLGAVMPLVIVALVGVLVLTTALNRMT
ncbi:MAG: MFS transporter, partial [Burkholderiales bacterium PBB4]